MKKRVVAWAAVGLGLVAGPALGQSKVTLYGILDGGLLYTSNSAGGKVVAATSNNTYPARWGLKGSEDLGGGTRAVFQLEAGFNLDNGTLMQGGREFGRQAYVGLANDRLGTVTLGRQYDLQAEYTATLSASYNWAAPFTHPGDLDNFGFDFRLNNAVKYTSPDYGGLQFGGLYSFGGIAGDFSRQSAHSFGVQYKRGGFRFDGSYLYVKNPASAVSEGTWTVGSPGAIWNSAVQPYTAGATVATPDALQTYAAGGSWSTGPYAVAFVYSGSRLKNIDHAGHDLRYDNYEINASWNATPTLLLGAAYIYTDGSFSGASSPNPKFHTTGVFTDYSVSKRTDLYALAAFQFAAGDADHAQGNGYDLASSTNRQLTVGFGVRHTF